MRGGTPQSVEQFGDRLLGISLRDFLDDKRIMISQFAP